MRELMRTQKRSRTTAENEIYLEREGSEAWTDPDSMLAGRVNLAGQRTAKLATGKSRD